MPYFTGIASYRCKTAPVGTESIPPGKTRRSEAPLGFPVESNAVDYPRKMSSEGVTPIPRLQAVPAPTAYMPNHVPGIFEHERLRWGREL